MVIVKLTLIRLFEIYYNLCKHLKIFSIVKMMIVIIKIRMELTIMMINMIKILMNSINPINIT